MRSRNGKAIDNRLASVCVVRSGLERSIIVLILKVHRNSCVDDAMILFARD